MSFPMASVSNANFTKSQMARINFEKFAKIVYLRNLRSKTIPLWSDNEKIHCSFTHRINHVTKIFTARSDGFIVHKHGQFLDSKLQVDFRCR